MNYIFAKSNPKTTLFEHSVQTFKHAVELCNEMGYNDTDTAICAIASLFHDIGKCTKDFQDYIVGKKEKAKYSHNIISAKAFLDYVEIDGLQELTLAKCVTAKIIRFHHPIPQEAINGKDSYIGLDLETIYEDNDIKVIETTIKELIEYFNKNTKLGSKLRFISKDYNSREIFGSSCEYYTNTSNRNSPYSIDQLFTIGSGVGRFADILASGNGNYKDYINFSFNQSKIKLATPPTYNVKRFNEQLTFAKSIVDYKVSSVFAPPGYGKTMLALLWLLSGKRKGIWVCPVNQIAYSMYDNVIKELKALGLENTVRVGLLLANEWVYGGEYGCFNDIIVTNIDNYTRPMFRSDEKKHMAFNMSCCNVVFDEYHQYGNKLDGELQMFRICVSSRLKANNVRTILISGTPNYKLFDRKHLLDENKTFKNTFKEINIENSDVLDRVFNIHYKNGPIEKDSLVVRNSVKNSQRQYNELKYKFDDIVCVHSRFTKKDYNEIMKDISIKHGKGGSKKQVVCSTNIFTTGVDVSFKNLFITKTYLDELIQTIGRINRWGEYNEANVYVFDYEKLKSKSERDSERKAVDTKYSNELCNDEYNFLKSRIKEGKTTLRELYEVRNALLDEETSCEECKNYQSKYKKYYMDLSAKSALHLSKLDYTYSGMYVKDNNEHISKKITLRTNSNEGNVFVRLDGMNVNDYIQIDESDECLCESNAAIMAEELFKAGIIGEYIGSRTNFKTMHRKKLLGIFLEKAHHSNTPFVLTKENCEYNYNKTIGLYKNL